MIRLPAALLALAVGLALSGIGCGGGDGTDSSATDTSPSASGAQQNVLIRDYEYDPATIAVPVGSVLRFTNRDSTPHTVTSKESGLFDSGSIDTGETGRVKLDEVGMYAYYCAFHPFMKGMVRVE